MGMVFVGGSVAVSGTLAGAPLYTSQALRYAVACALLTWFARRTGQRVQRPRGAEWAWLLGVAVSGLLLFNVALVHGSRHAEPAVLGVAVACVPVLLALLGPALDGGQPRARVLLAAVVVTTGAVLVEGVGRTDALGVLWAAVVFATEAGFTLLAVPVLGRHGPWGVSVHTTWLATVAFAVLGIAADGPGAVGRLDASDLLALAYLAVAVTAVAFVLWYSCVRRLGAGRAGLLTGVAPVAAAWIGVPLGDGLPSTAVWGGIALIATGLAVGVG
jgi:drug/metabolite transporter (DMT)-like permease